ncbi:uncharacterized protein LOC141892898 [Acropora palmata]|uniref:uncharacterized protein LOC141892898 n=1 Tax=Acropora palmata TaxID=6131 RepID=UPI003DA043E2
MKNARQVCSCRDGGELKFAGMDGSVVIGCQNTPAKGIRYCEIRKDVAKEYVNDEIGVGNIASKSYESTGLLIVKVLNEKCTWQEKCLRSLLSSFFVDSIILCKKHITCQPPEYKEWNVYCSRSIIPKNINSM